MRTMTATTISRGFAAALDAVEHGDVITITRGGHPVAELRPVTTATGRSLARALDAADAALDEAFESDVHAATDLLTPDEGDPWRDA
ncbi:prevent-host-death protein [Cellulomonas sp. ES6]|uniref:type II toxin-antitoxin system Phd/YefM family antitoxin n=1 Tax=Cellulomonas sp. ES6 TaxID=3039384 RepID=UPI0024B75B9F|nr:prevent-host-death protein [Cellulomonas sp. ES6]WHP15999.1 prevent-host-death protein [Cellulomonas sp. ES6]